MATDFTQDAVLHFLQSSGGSVKNSDLLLHFRAFIRDHPDRNRNRELFKKFVNSVATVKQVDGVSHVILRKKFKGHVPGGGEGSSPEPRRLPAGKNSEHSPENVNRSPANSAEKPRQKPREVTAAAPPGGTAEKTILPAAGIMLNNNNNNVETNLSLKQRTSAPELSGRPAGAPVGSQRSPGVSEPPAQEQSTKVGQHRLDLGPPHVGSAAGNHGETRKKDPEPIIRKKAGLQPEPPDPDLCTKVGQQTMGFGPPHVGAGVRNHGEKQVPERGMEASLQQEWSLQCTKTTQQVPETLRGRKPEGRLHPEPPAPDQGTKVGQHRVGFGPPAVVCGVRNHGETNQQVPETVIRREAGLQLETFPHPEPQINPKFGQHRVGFGPPAVVAGVRNHGETTQQVPERGREAAVYTEPPAPDRSPKLGQHTVSFGPPPVVVAARNQGEISHQVPETLRGRKPEGRLHGEPPAPDQSTRLGQHTVSFGAPPVVSAVRNLGETSQQIPKTLHQEAGLQLQDTPRRIRHRKSYKSAVSYDDDEDEGEVQVEGGSAGGARPLSAPLRDTAKATDLPAPPSVVSSSSSSSERPLPQIYVQDVEAETAPPGGSGWSGQWAGPESSSRRSLPLDAERYVPSPFRDEEAVHHRDVHADRRYSQPGSPGGLQRNSSCDDLQARAGKPRGGSKIQEVLQRAQESTMHRGTVKTTAPWYHSTGNLLDDREPAARRPPFHHSTDRLHDDQGAVVRMVPWHLSTGDLCDDREDAESSEGSTSSPPLRQRPGVARRLSSQLRNRMCRSLGADLDQLLQEQARATGGSEAARLNRLHMISSSLSLRYNLSSSSLSSCSTPPRSQSFGELVEEKGGRRVSTAASTAQQEGKQSLVPLEPREHAWLVKGAAGAWPDIYALFREDTSLLNRQDFISGFTVLHWIAKHGDHRVLNTL
ncbi:uncharacterized protein LOC121964458, partial [Plectropomus leopardus]|uniref:uncharacterized protein LOC121964458 n=1 Tax=Plectropomus leopardus TaxID=160734 RepID=UPI001C4C5A05